MAYRFFLILFVTFGVSAEPVAAQDSRYRVEIIVLSRPNADATPREVETLRDYSNAVDFLAPEPAADESDAGQDAPASTGAAGASADEMEPAPGGEPEDAAAEPAPPPLVHVEELSDVMRDAWRRLRSSAAFRPLLSLAWEQDASPPFPLLRVHDPSPVLTDDPWAAVRERLATGEPLDAVFAATVLAALPPVADPPDAAPTDRDAEPRDPVDEAAVSAPPAGLTLDRIPPPRRFYALDGTVSLVRSRFLHLHVDLQQREPVYAPADAQAPLVLPRGLRTMPALDAGGAELPAGPEPVPTAFRVFSLEQNRQVKTGQLEYFDGPVLSVLAYVTAIETPAESE